MKQSAVIYCLSYLINIFDIRRMSESLESSKSSKYEETDFELEDEADVELEDKTDVQLEDEADVELEDEADVKLEDEGEVELENESLWDWLCGMIKKYCCCQDEPEE